MISLHFLLAFVFLGTIGFFFRNRLRELEISLVGLIMQKFEQNLWERFWNILKHSLKGHKNTESIKHVIDIIS